MNFSLLDKIDEIDRGVLATILTTEGHTYKKEGEKALFVVNDPVPLFGNLGSLCVDQDIVSRGKEAYETATPKVIRVDTSSAEDIHLGYGTYCGGKMEILLEPILEPHKELYRELRRRLERGESTRLVHDLATGEVSIAAAAPQPGEDLFVETIPPLPNLFLFGATPLARRIAAYLEDADFRVHVVDWRASYLELCENLPNVSTHDDEYPFDERSLVLVLSHSFERDKRALREALSKRCAYIGLLSSKKRRQGIYAELRREGVPAGALGRVSSPVGIDIGGRSDPEIAVSIVAELIRFKNQ